MIFCVTQEVKNKQYNLFWSDGNNVTLKLSNRSDLPLNSEETFWSVWVKISICSLLK